jgi:hypothetical protein
MMACREYLGQTHSRLNQTGREQGPLSRLDMLLIDLVYRLIEYKLFD